jgi:hypothetical protein
MRRLASALAASMLALALVPSALAKGPIEASIEGPGLQSPITLGGAGPDALAPHQPLMRLAEGAGFFPAAFGRASWDDGDPRTKESDPMLPGRPSGALGPRYDVTYLVPGPEGVEDVLHQHLYPYAASGPVSYMPPGQPFFGWRETAGGWFRAMPVVLRTLVAAGLPATPPAATGRAPGDTFSPWLFAAVVAGAGAVAVVVGAALVRRRLHPAV